MYRILRRVSRPRARGADACRTAATRATVGYHAEVCDHWELDAYRPDPSWYLHAPGGIHGVGHAARVLLWANHLARRDLAAGLVIDLEAVRWAAVLHDVRRQDDGRDAAHGTRAAAWIRLHARTILPALTTEQVARVAFAVEWHVPDDHAAPWLSPELRALKDADGLDRVRLGDLDVRYLRTDAARARVRDAALLYRRSSDDGRGSDPWTAARAAGLRLGLWE
jgi:hypothetical protein